MGVSEDRVVRLLISGRVQGVFFRAFTRDEGRRLGVKGWVRNLPDGRVEVLAKGDPEQLEALEAFCRQGPPHARVHDVEVVEEEAAMWRWLKKRPQRRTCPLLRLAIEPKTRPPRE
jgi:acylphosphatase